MYILFNTGNSNNNAVNLHVEEDRIILNEREHLLSEIKSRTDFRSYSKIVFPLKQTSIEQRTISDQFGGTHYYPYSLNPFDLFTYTAETKYSQHEVSLITNESYEISFIFFPHHINFKDAILCVTNVTDTNVPFNITTTDSDNNIIPYVPNRTITQINSWDDYIYPKCTLEVIDTVIENNLPVTTIEFTYKDLDSNFISSNFNAYIRNTKGYVSHRKLEVVNGKARFKYIPLGLSSEEKSLIQVGIGRYSFITTIEI